MGYLKPYQTFKTILVTDIKRPSQTILYLPARDCDVFLCVLRA